MRRDIWVLGEAMVRAVNSYHVHFNRNVADDINSRTFETTGCGTMLLTNYTPGLEQLFKIGEEIVVYRDLDDLRHKARYYTARREKSLAPRGAADKIPDGGSATLALNSRSPRPTSVSPLTVSGLVHPGSGSSLPHS